MRGDRCPLAWLICISRLSLPQSILWCVLVDQWPVGANDVGGLRLAT